jgi:hypothetical protein
LKDPDCPTIDVAGRFILTVVRVVTDYYLFVDEITVVPLIVNLAY